MWRETPAQGSAASLLTAYFDRLWDEECAPAYERAPAWRKAGAARTQDELRSRWEAMETEYARAIAPADWEALTVPVEGCALLTNPINPGVKEPALWTSLVALMRSAEERVWIQTPYVVLDGAMRDGPAGGGGAGAGDGAIDQFARRGQQHRGLGGRGVPPGDGAFHAACLL